MIPGLRATMLMLLISTVLVGCASGTSGCSVDRAPFVRFGDVTYFKRFDGLIGYEPLDPALLGREFRRVTFKVTTDDCDYRAQDGHSSILAAGTPLYTIKGYRPEFLLGSIEQGQAYLYEADYVRGAKRGSDVLDVDGKVVAIVLEEGDDNRTELGRIDDAATITSFTRMIAEARVDYEARGSPREVPIIVSMHLSDGLVIERSYFQSSGSMGGILLTAAAQKLIQDGSGRLEPVLLSCPYEDIPLRQKRTSCGPRY
jgi:hypothetical protein